MLVQYEYNAFVLPFGGMIEYLERLNELGDEGWALISTDSIEGDPDTVCGTFMRVRTTLGMVHSGDN